MNFNRWFFADDTPRWKRASAMFLLVTTAIVLLAGLAWVFWSS